MQNMFCLSKNFNRIQLINFGINHKKININNFHVNKATSTTPTASSSASPSTTTNTSNENTKTNIKLPQSTKVVICGSGLIGLSVAYHLTQLGYKDIVVLTRNKIGSGTTFYSPGTIGILKLTPTETLLSKYSASLYEKLKNDGLLPSYEQVGSIGLAQTTDRWLTLKRLYAESRVRDIECHLLTPDECKEKVPLVKVDDLEGGIWIPKDGFLQPNELLNVFVDECKKNDIKIIEYCEVTRVNTKSTRGGHYYKIDSVETTNGIIKCDYFVNCAGIRARELGKLSFPRVKVPIHACEHHYLITKPFNVPKAFPIVRDYDGSIYMRNYDGGLLFGGFEKEAKTVFHDCVPKNFEYQTLQPDLDHFYPLIQSFLHRVPNMNDVEIDRVINGAEVFTPDTRMIMGESAEIDNYFVAAGLNRHTISLTGGVGRYIAELIAFGETDVQLWPVDTRRFVKLHNNRKFLRDRVKETVGKQYSLKYPTYGMSLYKSGRKLRTSPLHTRLLAAGAVYGENLGYERPLWYEPNSEGKDTYIEDRGKGSFGKPSWFETVRDEYMACRRGVAVIDMSSFTKFELKSAGREVVNFLQYMCCNDIDRPIGHLIHTGMLNHKGGYENDCSVVQLEPNVFMIISPATQQTRSMKWLSEHFPEDGSVLLSDVTSLYAAINVVGPKAVELLSELTDQSLSTHDFPQMTSKEIDIGYASGIIAMRLTHTGEDGFILYVPTEYALHVYDTIIEKGRNYGIANAGYFALRGLRIEKMFSFWGQDLDKNTTPYECGRDFRVKLDKDFIGKGALLQQREDRIKKRFVQFLIEDHDLYRDPWPWGNEPIYRNNKFCGFTTSTTYGFSLEKQVCLGYIHNFDEKTKEKRPVTFEYITKDAQYEIDIAGKRYRAKVNIFPPHLK